MDDDDGGVQWFQQVGQYEFINQGAENEIHESRETESQATAGTDRPERFGKDLWCTDDRQGNRRENRSH